MRRGFAGDGKRLLLRLANERDGLLGRNMAYMIAASRFANQPDITLDLPPFAFGGVADKAMRACVIPGVDAPTLLKQAFVLTVGDNGLADPLCLQHRHAHHFLGLHALAVIGKTNYIRSKRLEVRKFIAFLSASYRRIGMNANERIPLNGPKLNLEIFKAVRNGVKIRHGAYVGVTACCGCRRAARYRFLIRKAGLSKMYMNINKTRRYNAIVIFYYIEALFRDRIGNGNNMTAVDGDIALFQASVKKNSSAGNE